MQSRHDLDPSRIGPDSQQLSDTLYRLIVGQNEAIDQIVSAYQLYRAGLSAPDRPIASFLFLGPTGCGKTRLVEATAQTVLHKKARPLKIDCAEFRHSHEIAKLLGAAPGYTGHRDTPAAITQSALNAQCVDSEVKISFVLFDEIEKSSDALWNLLLGILDKAILTLGDNTRVDFSQTLIFLTSNLGAREMNQLIAPRFGYGSTVRPPSGSALDEATHARLSQTALEAVRRKFTPEFVNRLDKIAVFRPLDAQALERILQIELGIVQERMLRSSNGEFVVTTTEAANALILAQGTDSQYGARHLKRAIERLFMEPVSSLIASRQISPGDWIQADVADCGTMLRFSCKGSDLDIASLAVISKRQALSPGAAA